ncbi:Fur family transcriptional regulator [Pullulanibacillus sp. KACC 23026]|uniref:Fur family transcriptional regulator n=1 Tax=Pullulanibacillus sp. KACC 23026 TaxID=3028315 RepID=UPI0023B079BD|nr:Fur family transcriptional regulator [Pullulanibacillus sp. KACC 23026]WEG11954.1 Fur family transcriptional regulator [Pullulanibacillus sp. KACC 23026]
MTSTEALELLKKNGYSITDKREKIIHYFFEHPRYLSVKEVIDYLKELYPGLSFETVYRNLALFRDLGILEETELDGEKRFQVNCEASHHHHHVICLKCGKSKTIQQCPMSQVPEIEEFKIVEHKFEIYGYCSDCQ